LNSYLNYEKINFCEIDTRIIDNNEDTNILNNEKSENENIEELIFKGRNSKYPKRVYFIFIYMFLEKKIF